MRSNTVGEGSYKRLPALAADLVDRKVDVIVTKGRPGALAAKGATSTIPIVFIRRRRPGRGRPGRQSCPAGGQPHGRQHLDVELMPKLFELLSSWFRGPG